MSKYFQLPPTNHLHIIVQAPLAGRCLCNHSPSEAVLMIYTAWGTYCNFTSQYLITLPICSLGHLYLRFRCAFQKVNQHTHLRLFLIAHHLLHISTAFISVTVLSCHLFFRSFGRLYDYWGKELVAAHLHPIIQVPCMFFHLKRFYCMPENSPVVAPPVGVPVPRFVGVLFPTHIIDAGSQDNCSATTPGR